MDGYLEALGNRLRAQEWAGADHLLLLGGGYGRGEGGIHRVEGSPPSLYNDLEFYLVVPAPAVNRARAWCAQESHLGEEATGIEVEFKVMPRSAWRKSTPGMFTYDLAVGHVLVSGDEAILAELAPEILDPGRIPLLEATRLLFNRGSSLYFAGHALRFQTERSQGPYVERVQSKLKLALADAVLAARGGYDRSCLVRRERAAELTGDLPPDWPQMLAWHAEGVEFKLHPVHRAAGRQALEQSQADLQRVWASTWLWLESVRLGHGWDDLAAYAQWKGDLVPGGSGLRSFLLRVRDGLRYREVLPNWSRAPRASLMRALAAVHGGREDLAAAALGVSVDSRLIHDSFRRWWLRYN
ncbi:MAG: hypothetical protein SFU85_02565 [Candidatus Methylacidiphilales bacterium]|nr:hypothetical protein [Candidatus Methylacidiphilales bacterium]